MLKLGVSPRPVGSECTAVHPGISVLQASVASCRCCVWRRCQGNRLLHNNINRLSHGNRLLGTWLMSAKHSTLRCMVIVKTVDVMVPHLQNDAS